MTTEQPKQNSPFNMPAGTPGQLSGRTWAIISVVFVVFVMFNRVIALYTDWRWFQSINLAQIFTTEFSTKIIAFLIAAVIFIILFMINIAVARWQVKRDTIFFSDESIVAQKMVSVISWSVALLLGWLVGSTASGSWLTILEYIKQVPFGISDPFFGLDVSFYIFTLPLMKFAQGWLVIALFLSLFGAAGIYLLEQRNNLEEGRLILLPHAQLHLSIIGALIFAAFAWGHWLDAFGLLYSDRGVVFGASYTDINVVLPILRVMMGVAGVSALLLIVNIFVRKNKLPMAAIFLWLVGGFLLRGVAPGVIQRFVVEPNELNKEAPYIEQNIKFTNIGYNLNNISERSLDNLKTVTAAELDANLTTLDNVRLWDYRPLLQTFKQLQELRLYYTFHDVDLDRYTIDGKYRQVAVAVRELEKSQLQSPTWINQKLQFTHGYGMVMNPVNEVTPEGLPNFWVKDLPPQASVDLPITRPEIYFGENTTDYVFVKTNEREFDYPGEGDKSVYTNYEGTGGVPLNSYLTRLAFALRLGDSNIILSSDITNDSRILINRDIQTRVRTIAPFLRYDEDPYIVVADDGKLYWIQDAYTTSNLFPYSERISGQFNYIRNAVKVVIDPYNGNVSFYLFDENDPLAQTYARIFPGVFKPASTMPESLKAHVRYPEGLFKIQANLYQSYHMLDPNVFYNQEDLWAIPQENFSGNVQPVEPYYVIAKLPEESDEEFILFQPLTPHSKDNLVAWMAARSDGEHYGELVIYRLPKQELIFGPLQIEARIDQNPEISSQFSLWDQGGSQVIRGNLLVLPLGDTLLYVEPVYLQADSGRIPELKRVIVASGDQVTMANTLADALTKLLQGENASSVAETPQGSYETPAQTPADGSQALSEDVRQLAEQASAHYDAAQQALQNNDWATYGSELEQVKILLDQLVKVSGAE